MNIDAAAQRLDDAQRQVGTTTQPSLEQPYTLEQAYTLQQQVISRRVGRGERIVGIKLGLTSEAKMAQANTDRPVWGTLTDAMVLREDAALEFDRFTHPLIEPELCFLTKHDITGPLTLQEARRHLDAVASAIEIVDSRYRDFRFYLPDVIADNCSAAALAIGPWTTAFDAIQNADVDMAIDKRTVQTGSTSAILGNPLLSVVQASILLTCSGITLPAGSIIMAGATTPAVALPRACRASCTISGIGHVEFDTR